VKAGGGLVLAAALLAAAAVTGCGGHRAGAAASGAPAPACEAVRPDPGSLIRVDGLEGAYRLVVVAESGPAAGRSVEGELGLIASDSAGVPFRGWTEAPVGLLGATVPGDAASRDPAAPGVLVLVGPASPGADGPAPVTLRLGSYANSAGPPRFDGSYAALHVREIAADGFSGEWSSGVAGPQVEGRFCAIRTGAPQGRAP
jgi:hypothetical protein